MSGYELEGDDLLMAEMGLVDDEGQPTTKESTMTTTQHPDTSDVRRYILKAHPAGETAVTGVPLSHHGDTLTVRMFSAGCLHGTYDIQTAGLIRTESY